MKFTVKLFLAGLALGLMVWTLANPTESESAANDLKAVFTATAPAIDGRSDAVWQRAQALIVRTSGGANTGKHLLRVKALYDQNRVYFLFQWNDPTESLAFFPWEKQADGSWKKLSSPDDDEQKFAEDKIALLWAINAPTFIQEGCMYACHVGDGGKAFGNMIAGKGELLDMWHWKAVRSNPVGHADDQYLDDTAWSKDKPNAGRKSDPLTGGGYKDNANQAKSAPAVMPAPGGGKPPRNWVLASESVPFTDSFKTGDRVGGVIVSPFAGDRGDLTAKGVWSKGQWMVEISRPLVTGSKFDVQYNDLNAGYYFAPAVFDNAEVRHAFTMQTYRLVFAPSGRAKR
jgi:hypothetical protein